MVVVEFKVGQSFLIDNPDGRGLVAIKIEAITEDGVVFSQFGTSRKFIIRSESKKFITEKNIFHEN